MKSHRPFSSNAFKGKPVKRKLHIIKALSNNNFQINDNTFTKNRPKTSLKLLKEKSNIFAKSNDNLDLINLMIKSSPNQYNPKRIHKKIVVINPLYIRGTDENLKRPNFNQNTEKVFYKYNLLYGNNTNNLIRTYSPKMRPMSSSINEYNKKLKNENDRNVFIFNDEEIMELIKARCKDIGISLRDNMIYKFKNFINSKCRNRCVDLSDNYLGINSIRLISDYIYRTDRISRLNITKNNIGDQGIEILMFAIKNTMTLISLNVTSNNITYRGGQIIFEDLSEQKSLIDLNISSIEGTNRNRLTYLGLKYLDVFFKKNEFIETLNIAGNSIKDEGFIILCKALNDNKNLLSLNISNNEMRSPGLIQGLTYISFCKLTSLNLSNNQLLDSGIKSLSNSLKSFPFLRKLNISNCGFEFRGFEYLIKSLSMYKNIYTLNISGNVLKDKNFGDLKPFLETLAIKNLNMAKCSLGNEATFILGECFSNNESLKKLNISCNKISDVGFRSFKSLFQVNSVIEAFDCSQNLITDLSATTFVKNIKYNHSLKKLNLFDNQLTNNIGNILLELLHTNKTLRSVNLLLNRVQIKTIEEINKLIKYNLEKEKAKYVPDLYKSIKSLKFNPEMFKFYEKNIRYKKKMQKDLYKRVKQEDKYFSKIINKENKKIDVKINKKINIESEIENTQNQIKDIMQNISQLQEEIFDHEKEMKRKIEAEKKIFKKYKDQNELLQIEYNATKKSYDDIIKETILKQKKSLDKLNIAQISVNSKTKEINKRRELISKLYDPELLRPINNETGKNQIEIMKERLKKQSSSVIKKSTYYSEQNNTGISTNENMLTTTSGNNDLKKSIKKSILKKAINEKNKK